MSTSTIKRDEQLVLLKIAKDSITGGLNHGTHLEIDSASYAPSLQKMTATFVTLKMDNRLRGCIGSINAHRPLVEDVSSNAWSAAFRDPRFNPISRDEIDKLHISISILSQPRALDFTSEKDLKQKIRPGRDGLILSEAGHRGLFLPSVWESLPDGNAFIMALKQKAGLPFNYWSDTVSVEQFTGFEFADEHD